LQRASQRYDLDEFGAIVSYGSQWYLSIWGIVGNGGNIARKGLRRTSLSRYNEIDAGDDLCLPIKPFLAILHVGNCCFSVLYN